MPHFEVLASGFRSLVANDLPVLRGFFHEHAQLVEQFDLQRPEGAFCFAALGPAATPFPTLVVEQRYSPSEGGFHPGLLIAVDTAVAFLGAGERLLAYELLPRPKRLWTDTISCGFWGWSQHGRVVLASGELELIAWASDGTRLWSHSVEPPWSYSVQEDGLVLDIMGAISTFPLDTGPIGEA
jgi:hypothetical protein